MPDTELAEELLQIEEADAWFEYLESTRGQGDNRYVFLLLSFFGFFRHLLDSAGEGLQHRNRHKEEQDTTSHAK